MTLTALWPNAAPEPMSEHPDDVWPDLVSQDPQIPPWTRQSWRPPAQATSRRLVRPAHAPSLRVVRAPRVGEVEIP